MNYSMATREYREAAIWGASQVELVIMMYDLLIEDLNSTSRALRSGDVERRTMAVKHAFAVLEQLQLNINSGAADAAESMNQLYSLARARVLEATLKQCPATIEDICRMFVDLKQAWKKSSTEAPENQSHTQSTVPETGVPVQVDNAFSAAQPDHSQDSGWSA